MHCGLRQNEVDKDGALQARFEQASTVYTVPVSVQAVELTPKKGSQILLG
jgi:hypothetical protein